VRIGDIWKRADTDNEILYMTVTHFRVTTDVLNGDWKETKLQHPLPWNAFEKLLDIQHVVRMSQWRAD